MRSNGISVISNRRHISLPVEDILYIQLAGRRAVIYASGGRTYETYTTIEELEQMLGSGFILTDRATLVAAKGIHAIGRQIELINGETLDYAHRRKRELKEQLRADWRQIAQSLSDSDAPATREDYQRHYASYDSAPFAFTDIEMVFNEKRAAVDWIFRYANEALARLEKKPLEQLIDRSFSSIFPNMDNKWLRVYERTALFGETLEIIDHSPEIDTDLKIICFPTFKGHCGCILFKQAEIQTMRVEKPGARAKRDAERRGSVSSAPDLNESCNALAAAFYL